MRPPPATDEARSYSALVTDEHESRANAEQAPRSDGGFGDAEGTQRPHQNSAVSLSIDGEDDVPFVDEDVDPLILEMQSSKTDLERYSLALSPSSGTPRLFAILIPLLALASHALFLHGQIAPMWLLRESREIDVWANATSSLSKTTFDALGLAHEQHYAISEEKDVDTFTYSFAIKQLWRAKGLPNKSSSRFAAVLLVLFSGVWPHLKLALMNLYWLLPTKEKTRHNALYWLSSLGKWSLADVLVVCVMMCVLNLDWTIDTIAIKHGVVKELPTVVNVVKEKYTHRDLCHRLLKFDCEGHDVSWGHWAKCHACWTVVSQAYEHPNWAETTGNKILDGVKTSGGGHASLRILGMGGIYSFCAAVVLSIFLSLVVDVFDQRARVRAAEARSTRRNQGGNSDVESGEPLLDHQQRSRLSSNRNVQQVKRGEYLTTIRNTLVAATSCVTLVIVLYAIRTPTMERVVTGALPTVLRDVLGMKWERKFSLRTLMETTGEAGGADLFLMMTFGLFIVFGPMVRACLCLFGGLLNPFTNFTPRFLQLTIDLLGAFTAWEVITVAAFMVGVEMPPITNTILERPECKEVSSDGSCLTVNFNLLNDYGMVIAGWALLLASSFALVKLSARPSSAL